MPAYAVLWVLTALRAARHPGLFWSDFRNHQRAPGFFRRAILAGWVVTMLGIALYIRAMSRAGENAGILDGLTGQGPVGWIAGLPMLAGVVTWFVGNYACLQELADVTAGTDE